jgi:hypothetical protein
LKFLRRNILSSPAVLGLMALWAIVPAARAADPHSDDSVKAAYLYRFAGYVDWKDKIPSDAPFTIAVLGAPGVARELRRLLPGHVIDNRVAQVREITGAQDLGKPQVLYAGPGRARSLRALLAAAGSPAVLSVTDEDGGLAAGSAVNFLRVDQRIRFEVSLAGADRAGLKISSEMLGVAVRVHGGMRPT